MEFIAHGVRSSASESRNHQKQKQDKLYLKKSARIRTNGGLKLGKLIKWYWKRFNCDWDLLPFKLSMVMIIMIYGLYILDGR